MNDTVRGLRVLIVAGIPVGVLVGGVLSRLAMLLLRLTSPDRVRGVESDDGFEIGRFTLGGTYNLLALGAVVGVIGAAAYQWVRPWLLGPQWFRYLTCGAGAGAVVGSMLVHADGVDFTLLEPTWLAVGLFVGLPAIFGTVIGPAVEAIERRPGGGWVVPVVLVAVVPPTLFVLVPATFLLGLWHAAKRRDLVVNRATTFAVRAVWLGVATLGLVTLTNDVRALVH